MAKVQQQSLTAELHDPIWKLKSAMEPGTPQTLTAKPKPIATKFNKVPDTSPKDPNFNMKSILDASKGVLSDLYSQPTALNDLKLLNEANNKRLEIERPPVQSSNELMGNKYQEIIRRDFKKAF